MPFDEGLRHTIDWYLAHRDEADAPRRWLGMAVARSTSLVRIVAGASIGAVSGDQLSRSE